MNLAQLILQFYALRRSRAIASVAADLYIFLLHECDKAGGENPLCFNDEYVMGCLTFSKHRLRKARIILFEEGLLNFNVGNGSNCTIYQLTTVQLKEVPKLPTRHGEQPEDYDVRSSMAKSQQDGAAPDGDAEEAEDAITKTFPGVMPLEYDEVVTLFREHCPRLNPKIRKNAQSVENVRLRLQLLAQGAADRDAIRGKLVKSFATLNQIEYLCGQNDKHWKATFNWIFNPEKQVFEKLAKGTLFAREADSPPTAEVPKDYSMEGFQREIAQIEAMRAQGSRAQQGATANQNSALHV